MATRLLRLRLLKADHILYEWFQCCDRQDGCYSQLIERAAAHYISHAEYLYMGTIRKPDCSTPVAPVLKNISIPKGGVLDTYLKEHPDVNINEFLKKIMLRGILISATSEAEEYVPGRYDELKPVLNVTGTPAPVPVLSTKDAFAPSVPVEAGESSGAGQILKESQAKKESNEMSSHFMSRIIGDDIGFG